MTARLESYADLAPEIRHFVFEAPGAGTLTFAAGQFASLTHEIGGRAVTRAYSVAAPPAGGNRFEICLNRVQDGIFSPFLFGMKSGDEVELRGFFGTFGWRTPMAADSVLIATGTGIVPFRAMLLSLPAASAGRKITLIYGTRYSANLLYAVEFLALEAARPEFRFLPTVTRPEADWQGCCGRVQPLLLAALQGDGRDLQVYVCGLREMVDDVRRLCKEHGMERQRIIYERYD